jgi:peptide/nickel transport system substrate-binding protein
MRDQGRHIGTAPGSPRDRLSRRDLLGRGIRFGVAAAALGSIREGGRIALAAPAGKRGGRLVFAMGSDQYSPAPYVYGGNGGAVVNANIYNGLLRIAPSGKAVPDLAESVIVADPTTYVFRLHHGVKFHAGGEMTADDVEFSLEYYMSGKVGATRAGVLNSAIAAVAAVDRYAVKLTLKQPNATLLSILALPDLAVISKAWVDAGHDYRKEWNGTGPFKMADGEPGDHYTMVRNPDYFKHGLPYLDTVDVRVVLNDVTRVDGVRAGQYDVANLMPWQNAKGFQTDPKLHVETIHAIFNAVVLNHSRKPLDDVRVRQAISYAIDRDAVNKIGSGGFGIPLTGGLFTAGSPWFCKDNAKMYTYQPDKARALLREAGYPNGITLDLTLANFTPYLDPFNVVQQNLQAVGIKVNVISTDTDGMAQFRGNGKYAALWTGTSLVAEDPDAYSVLYASTGPFYGTATNFKDPILDDLFAKGRSELNQAKRKAIYCDLEHRALDGAYWTFITYRPDLFGMRADVKNIHAIPGAMGILTPNQLEQAWVDR